MSEKRKGLFGRMFRPRPSTPLASAPPTRPSATDAPTPKTLQLNRSLLDAEVDENWTACIDFGTAFSKIVMVRRHEPGTTAAQYVRPLRIGSGSTTGFSSLMCPSALYILQDRIHFGERAFVVHANHGADSRECFESPKHYISKPQDQGLLETPPSQAEDPTQCFTRKHLLLLLLGFVVFRFDSALQKEDVRKGRVPRLRIARPAWESEFEQAGEALLLDLLARAFILARTIDARYDTDEGLPIGLALSALKLVDQVSEPSAHLKAKLISEAAPEDCIQRGFVPEATAVAAAAIRPEQGKQRVFVVADIGAGTSDFGAFTAVPGQYRHGKIGEYPWARRLVEKAGNFLDSKVVSYLKKKHGLNDEMPADVATIAALRREARQYKEDLFRDGEVLSPLQGDLREFLAEPEVTKFLDELRASFGETLKVACEQAATLDQQPPVRVLLTGGGAALPFVRELASMSLPNFLTPIEEDPTPPWVTATNWSVSFRQLAVAVGGAMPSLPEQK